ncbi:hypothetical protein NUSPORA_01299 [Nucleospora cyclopteri]
MRIFHILNKITLYFTIINYTLPLLIYFEGFENIKKLRLIKVNVKYNKLRLM